MVGAGTGGSMTPVARMGRSHRLFYGGLAVVMCMVIAASLLSLEYLRREAELRTISTTQNLSRSVEQTIESVVDTLDSALLASTDEIARQLRSGVPDPSAVTEFMVRLQTRNPRLNLLRATNTRGEVIYGAGIPLPPTSISDRDYFRLLRDDPQAGLVIAKPLIGKISEKRVWVMARRINRPDGSFGGLVYASIFIDELEAVFARIELNAGDSIALRDSDLGLIARHPAARLIAVPAGDRHLSKAFEAALKIDPVQGAYSNDVDSIDGVQRMHSYRRNAKYGFTINVGIERTVAMSQWHRQVVLILSLLAAFVLVTLIFGWQVGRAWRRNDRDMEALRANQISLNEAQEIASLGRFSLDLRTLRWTGSGVLENILGIDASYPRDVQHWLLLVSESDRPACQAEQDRIVSQGGTLDREYRITRYSDGQERWVCARGKVQMDAQGRPALLQGTLQDITQRKQAEVLLLESEDRYRTAFMISPDAVNITRMEDGRYIDVSEGFQRITGWTREEVIGKTSVELNLWANPADRQRMAECVKRDGGCDNLEITFIAKDGHTLDGLMSAHAITLQGERCLLSVTRDISARKKVESALRESELRLSTLINWTPEAIAVHRGGKIIYANPSTQRMMGATDAQELLGKPLMEFVHPDYRAVAIARVNQQTTDGTAVPRIEEKFVKLDGTAIDVEVQATPIFYDGAPAIQVAMRDITALKLAQERLELAASVFSHAREGIAITDAKGTIIDVNDTFTRITGYPRDEAVGRNPRILRSGRQSGAFYEKMWSDLNEKGYWDGEVWNRRKNGDEYMQQLTISAVRREDASIRNYVALLSDITEQKQHERQLEHMAHFDALTGLPNRVLLADRLQQALNQAQRREEQLAVVYLDLDGFKAVNDCHGHQVGDELLVAVATAMKQSLREGDTLARIGGDEFVVVLIDVADEVSTQSMLVRLLKAAAERIQVGAFALQVSASMGVTFYPQAKEVDADQLMRQADQAMYQAKLAGKNQYYLFDAEQDQSIRGHHESLERIRQALRDGELVLHYQPKVDMRAGEVIGVEALIRWEHPEQGLLPPLSFLPVVEDTALAVEIGEWVVDTALTQLERWRAVGLHTQVSVNVGARQLQQLDFVERLRGLLAAHPGVRPDCLELEILETSALQDVAQVSQLIETCSKLGVTFALDDFGTGYSSLTYLKRLRVGMLKIDQSFVRDMLDDPDDLAILEGVIGLAASFRRAVIAEGVESVAHGTLLMQLGCHLAQGYGIARPMPASEMPGWVAQWKPEPAWQDSPWHSDES